MPTPAIESWQEILRKWRARRNPWLIVPTSPLRSDACCTLSYDHLYVSAVRAAQEMRSRYRDALRIVVVADNTPECCACIFGALLSGLTLVPIPPRALGRPHVAWRGAIEALLRECSPAILLGSEADTRDIGGGPSIPACSFTDLLQVSGGQFDSAAAPPDPSNVALWQHTSGTTGAARAVQLTHANIVENVFAIGRRIEASPRDVGATWLPMFHDMGLVGSLLFSAYWGMSLVLLPPRSFVARPEAWLWAISRFNVTCSAAPNVAYEICASKVKASTLTGLNLASWRVAFNGAELVHAPTVQRFCERFRAYGFREQAMYPVYGLAEHTVAATLPDAVRGAAPDWVDQGELEKHGRAVGVEPYAYGARAVVAVGSPLSGHEMRLVNTHDEPIGQDRLVGEIQLRGPSRMLGYRGQSESFAPGGWLRTGDLGYVVDGSLHVVGRRKHMIKRGGRWIDGALVEGAARAVDGVRGAVVAAFGVPDNRTGTERLIVLAETARLAAREEERLRCDITRAIVEAASVRPDVIAFVRPGSIPRTTSGKVQHCTARQKYLDARGAVP